MAKIVIDPGHGGSDSGGVHGTRREKDDVLRLAFAVGKILEEKGEDVSYTRVSDVYNTPFEKAMMANTASADFLLSLHRNSALESNLVNGVEALVYDDKGLKVKMAQSMLDHLEKAGFQNRGILERPNLTILRRSNMPAIILEVGFVDNVGDNKLFDEHFDDIAAAIADAILGNIVGMESKRPPLYRVQVGAYRNYENADTLLNKLLMEGYPAFMLFQDGIYRVQVGAYQILDNAIRMEQRLRSQGYPTLIVTN